MYDYVHHDAVIDQVWVVDKAAWEEPVYTKYYVCLQCEYGECEYCNEHGLRQNEFLTFEEKKAHQYNCAINGGSCSNSTTRKKVTDYIHHDEEGHYETVIVSEAYDEPKLIGYKCSCGATK